VGNNNEQDCERGSLTRKKRERQQHTFLLKHLELFFGHKVQVELFRVVLVCDSRDDQPRRLRGVGTAEFVVGGFDSFVVRCRCWHHYCCCWDVEEKDDDDDEVEVAK